MLKANPRNPNKHPADQIRMIRASIDEFGWTQPCVIDEKGKLWGGHGRRLAALVIDQDGKPLEYPDGQERPAPLPEVPCVVAIGWTKVQKDAYLLADNRLPELAETDLDLQREFLRALDGVFDLAKAGFDAIALPQLLAEPNAGATDPDEMPAPPTQVFVRTGDMWTIGVHRLLCGDSTKVADVGAILAGDKPHLMVTDAPYGVEYDAAWRDVLAGQTRADGKKGGGAGAVGQVVNDDRSDWRETWQLFAGDVVYCWHDARKTSSVQASIEAAGFEVRYQIIWPKPHFAIGRGDYHWQHEACWYAVRKGKTAHWEGDRKQTTVWNVENKQNSETGHSTQKPTELMRRAIDNNSKLGDFVYEPFCGSGTTIIACEIAGRRCLAIEISPAYVQVAIERWQKFSGKAATLNGKTLEQVARARKKGRALASS